MVKYWQISGALALGLFLVGLSSSNFFDAAIAQTSSRDSSVRNQDIARLKRSGQRWIEIDRRSQTLVAWQGRKQIYSVIVSTGKSDTPTPSGIFKIQVKYPKARMEGEDYNVPDVPNVMYYSGNYAIHGAYWHRSFGIPISQGCTNLPPEQATRLYKWASVGTTVVVR